MTDKANWRLFDFVSHQLEHSPIEKSICDRIGGEDRSFSTREIEDISNQVANALLSLDLQKGDRIGMVVNENRCEFLLLDLGIQKAGLVSVPFYPTLSIGEFSYILKDSNCKAIFFGSGELGEKMRAANESAGTLQYFYAFDSDHPTEEHWQSLWSDAPTAFPNVEISSESLATLIYTSGTTGKPKGVMISHRNIVSNVIDVCKHLPVDRGTTVISFLPLSHVMERVASFTYLYQGVSVHYCATDQLGGPDGALQRVKPNFFTCVPRLLEKIYEKIYARGQSLTGLKKKLFFWSLSLADSYEYGMSVRGIDRMKWWIADRLVFSKWRAALGNRVVGIVTGSAPCPVKILRTFCAAGIPIREGYGLTESATVITVNRYGAGDAKMGTVGPTIDRVHIRIDDSDTTYGPDEGEIWASGPSIMMGYYNKPEETARTLKEKDGRTWLLTGDIGRIITENGVSYLKITDRKKELLKTSAGKYIAPAPIESRLKEHSLVEQAMVVGDGKKYASVVISIAIPILQEHCLQQSIPYESAEKCVSNEKVIATYAAIVDEVNADLARHEQIKRFTLVPDLWVPVKVDGSTSELTPTLKIKRRVLMKKYQADIEAMYD